MTRPCPDCRQTEWHLISCPRAKEPVAVGTRVGEEYADQTPSPFTGWECRDWQAKVTESRLQAKLGEAGPADMVNRPPHYTGPLQPLGLEVIQVTELFGFCLGNALKYIFRADWKGSAEQDLRKAIWYLERELARRAAE